MGKEPNSGLLLRTVAVATAGKTGSKWDFSPPVAADVLLPRRLLALLMLARRMPFAAVARIVGESAHRVLAVCQKYVQVSSGLADSSDVRALAIDETSRARGHSDVTLSADSAGRRVLFVTEGREAKAIEQVAQHLSDHGCLAENIASVGIDMSPAFIAGVTEHLAACTLAIIDLIKPA